MDKAVIAAWVVGIVACVGFWALVIYAVLRRIG
jgi:hypothetical protein